MGTASWGRGAAAVVVLLVLALGCGGWEDPSPGRLEQVLSASWRSYRQQFISPEGRVMIPERGGETISEAQAYALLRAVWAGDKATFARVFAWTQKNLSRPDHLLSWRWGARPDGSLVVLDQNSATDADLDYALALVLAARRGWGPPPEFPGYLEEARLILAAVWDLEVVTLPGGQFLLTPGNWHEPQPPYLTNPSYFSPAAYRLFSQVFTSPKKGEDRGGSGWTWLLQSTYDLLDRLNQGLGDSPGVRLFPDWCRVDAQGVPQRADSPGRESDCGWEAARLPWRVTLDGLWFGEPRAAPLLSRRFLPFMKEEWRQKGKLAAVYHYDGTPAADFESPVMTSGVLAAALAAGDQEFARELARRLISYYREEGGQAFFVSPDNYYAQNWAWLGLATYAGWVKPFANANRLKETEKAGR
jgi:endo-1,4-beta-D-glucanase Y